MAFPTFPEFAPLTLNDRAEYERRVASYPPIADISFAALMGWWGLYHAPKVAILNENLVIDYPIDFDKDSTGLCLIGTNEVDESICAIFEYLREHGREVKLVHTPEFVIDHMRYPELFNFNPERNYDEYLIPLSNFYPAENSSAYQRHRVESFMNRMEGSRVGVMPLDMSKQASKDLLINKTKEWPNKGVNRLSEREREALINAIKNADRLGLHVACLKINDVVEAFMIFHAPADQKYITIEYARFSYRTSHLTNFAAFMFAEWSANLGVEYANLCMDYGKPILRVAKLALKPANFFRKYTLEPQTDPALAQSRIAY